MHNYGDTFISRIDTGTEYIAVLSVQLFASDADRQEINKLLSALPDHDAEIVFSKSDSSIWSQLIRSQALQIEFHEIQTKITEEDLKDSSCPIILNVYRHAQDVVSHLENWPSIISVAYTGYETLKDGDAIFSNVKRVRADLYGRKGSSDPGKDFIGLVGMYSHLHLQISSIKNLLQVYSFWDSTWRDLPLEMQYAQQIAQARDLESTIQHLAKLLQFSKNLGSYDETCTPGFVDTGMVSNMLRSWASTNQTAWKTSSITRYLSLQRISGSCSGCTTDKSNLSLCWIDHYAHLGLRACPKHHSEI